MRKAKSRAAESEDSGRESQVGADSYVEQQLSSYLAATISRFRQLGSGWQTDVFEFEVSSPWSRADTPAGRPLVLKVYRSGIAAEKCARESFAMHRLKDAGYPVQRPYLLERNHEPLGKPFMIMERVNGQPLFAFDSVPKAMAVFVKGFVPFVRAHAALHSLNAQIFSQVISDDGELPAGDGDCGSKSSSLLSQMLMTIAERIEQSPLSKRKYALEW